MSFLKGLFEKRKDIKYGKGHKLGDGSQSVAVVSPRDERPSSSASRPQSSLAQSEAAKKAGEAALARLQNKNAPIPKAAKPVSLQSQVSREQENVDEQEKELNKALKLKEHYFGGPKVDEACSVVAKNQIRFKSPVLGTDESFLKDEIEDRIEQALLVQLDDEPILVAVTLLFTANQKNPNQLNKCVEILNKFIDNILTSPNEEKYRKIRVENAIFKEKVYSCKYSDLVLKKGGFKPMTIKKVVEQEPKPDEAAEAVEVEEDFFVFEGDNFEKLENLKEALALGEPIVPQLDRDVRVYRVTSASGVASFDLSQDFYNLTIEDLRREQKIRDEALEKQGMLRTKAMRERDEQMELKRYNYCMVRVRFPDEFIMQALFKTTETFGDLYNLVQENLKYDSVPFELFGHALRKTTTMDSTLAEAGIAPSALLNFKWNEDSVIEAAASNFDLKHILKADLVARATLLE